MNTSESRTEHSRKYLAQGSIMGVQVSPCPTSRASPLLTLGQAGGAGDWLPINGAGMTAGMQCESPTHIFNEAVLGGHPSPL